MSIQNPLPVSIVQMALVEKIAEIAHNQPLVQQQVAQEAVARELREKQVEPAQAQDAAKGVKSRGQRDGRPGQDTPKKREEQKNPGEESAEPGVPDNPLAGILVNRKV